MTVDCDVKFMREALRTATDDGADPALSPTGASSLWAAGSSRRSETALPSITRDGR